MSFPENPLDNPVWSSLTDIHFDACIDYGSVKFYHPDFTPFGAFTDGADTSDAIEKHAKLLDRFFIVGEQPKVPASFNPPKRYVGLQMIIYNEINQPITEDIIELNETHYIDLMDLIDLVYPHFFKKNTNKLGRYYGIYKNNQLVAVTGERMQTNNFTEISAVATHPDHTGKGYAKQLITHTSKNIFKENKIPFLHVDNTNLGPINLYKKLGFTIRREMQYWLISR
ncbi:GNAT family N-acetyltransferase [Seonamhaeicola sp.]|uniref:GNAT family N-acetyltransferase n=1 Tax=Seonamhaeicola sp. TaxID=1912245 RepID=UPI0026165689|nr:GNAT family N-acetyltransferase [Seonamhaeicola sp.]